MHIWDFFIFAAKFRWLIKPRKYIFCTSSILSKRNNIIQVEPL